MNVGNDFDSLEPGLCSEKSRAILMRIFFTFISHIHHIPPHSFSTFITFHHIHHILNGSHFTPNLFFRRYSPTFFRWSP